MIPSTQLTALDAALASLAASGGRIDVGAVPEEIARLMAYYGLATRSGRVLALTPAWRERLEMVGLRPLYPLAPSPYSGPAAPPIWC